MPAVHQRKPTRWWNKTWNYNCPPSLCAQITLVRRRETRLIFGLAANEQLSEDHLVFLPEPWAADAVDDRVNAAVEERNRDARHVHGTRDFENAILGQHERDTPWNPANDDRKACSYCHQGDPFQLALSIRGEIGQFLQRVVYVDIQHDHRRHWEKRLQEEIHPRELFVGDGKRGPLASFLLILVLYSEKDRRVHSRSPKPYEYDC